MYYYKVKDNYVNKYSIVLNIEKLQELKNEIIDNCSVITHHCFKTTRPEENCINYRNYKKTKIGVKTYNNPPDTYNYKPDEVEYLVECDFYEFPKLVYHIIDLLSGNTSVIEKIINYKDEVNDLDFEEKKILEEQDKLIKQLAEETSEDISKHLELIANNHKKIMSCKKNRELNKNQVPASSYIKQVLSCINMKEVGMKPLKSVLEVKQFLEDSKKTTTESDLYKKLTLTKGTIK